MKIDDKQREELYKAPLVGAYFLKDGIHYIVYKDNTFYVEINNNLCELSGIDIQVNTDGYTKEFIDNKQEHIKRMIGSGYIATKDYFVLLVLSGYAQFSFVTGDFITSGGYRLFTYNKLLNRDIDYTYKIRR